jgi:hypothetical protein
MAIERRNDDDQEYVGEAYTMLDEVMAQQIARDLAGIPVDVMVYQFPMDGKQVTGITAKGALALAQLAATKGAARLSELEPPEPQDGGDHWHSVVGVENLSTGQRFYGIADQPKEMELRDKSTRPDKFAKAKAYAKARRNAILAHFAAMEELIELFVGQQSADSGRRVIMGDTAGTVLDESRRAQVAAQQGPGPKVGQAEYDMVASAATAAGLEKQEIKGFLVRWFGVDTIKELPADKAAEAAERFRKEGAKRRGEAPTRVDDNAPVAPAGEATAAPEAADGAEALWDRDDDSLDLQPPG